MSIVSHPDTQGCTELVVAREVEHCGWDGHYPANRTLSINVSIKGYVQIVCASVNTVKI